MVKVRRRGARPEDMGEDVGPAVKDESQSEASSEEEEEENEEGEGSESESGSDSESDESGSDSETDRSRSPPRARGGRRRKACQKSIHSNFFRARGH